MINKLLNIALLLTMIAGLVYGFLYTCNPKYDTMCNILTVLLLVIVILKEALHDKQRIR